MHDGGCAARNRGRYAVSPVHSEVRDGRLVVEGQHLRGEGSHNAAEEVLHTLAGSSRGFEHQGHEGHLQTGVGGPEGSALVLVGVVAGPLAGFAFRGGVERRVRGSCTSAGVGDHDIVCRDRAVLVGGNDVRYPLGCLGATFADLARGVDVHAFVSSPESCRPKELQDDSCNVVVALDAPAAPFTLATEMVTEDVPLRALLPASAGFRGPASAGAANAPARERKAHAKAEGDGEEVAGGKNRSHLKAGHFRWDGEPRVGDGLGDRNEACLLLSGFLKGKALGPGYPRISAIVCSSFVICHLPSVIW